MKLRNIVQERMTITASRKFRVFLFLATTLLIPIHGLAEESQVDSRISNLERQVEQLRKDLQNTRPLDVREFQERVERLEQSRTPGAKEEETGNMVFFRGGGAWLSSNRSNEVFTDVYGFTGNNDSRVGWYVGAGMDLVLSKNLWGLLSKTWAIGEIGVEFKRFNSQSVTQAVPTTCALASNATSTPTGCPVNTNEKVQITMLTVNVSPKFMFREGSRFRPWIIPIGLDFHVISPPSNDTTVLDIGAQFAVGAQYRIWKAFHLGLDGRYHLATNQTDTVNNFGTVGGYVGIAF